MSKILNILHTEQTNFENSYYICILQYTYHEFRKNWIPTILTNQPQPTVYIPQPEDFESMLEPKPPLKPLPDPALDADPQPIAAPELEPL